MISPGKYTFIVAMIIVGLYAPILAAEPNEPNEPNLPKTELKFETSVQTMTWTILNITSSGQTRVINNPGPIKPTHVAMVLLHKDYPAANGATNVMDTILKSPVAKRFSKGQQQFLGTKLAIRQDNTESIPFYHSTYLYATSEADAKLMVQAYVDGLNKQVEQSLSMNKQRLSQSKQELEKLQKELPEKEKQLEDVFKQYQNVKDTTHQFSSDEEAADMAKKSIIEMDKELNSLDIELAGIQERLKTTEKYKLTPPNTDIKKKLDEMYIELMIELSGLQARRDMTEKIRQKEQQFLSLFGNLTHLRSDVSTLNESIRQRKELVESLTKVLNDPQNSMMQPPKVYQDTVTIYPVVTDKN
jgi:hypothetical protein